MKDVMKEFVIRTYGRTELAQLYSPELTRQSAFRFFVILRCSFKRV